MRLHPPAEGLEKVYSTYVDRGLVVLGFPCDQFGDQNPEDDEGTAAFCVKNYGVTFPMFAEIEVNGDGAHPLYQWLKTRRAASAPARSSGTSPSS